jgi:hypothetical protein
MIQQRQHARFALESSETIAIGRNLRRQDLECDVPGEPGVACAIHLAHRAGANRLDDLEGANPHPGGQTHERCAHYMRATAGAAWRRQASGITSHTQSGR